MVAISQEQKVTGNNQRIAVAMIKEIDLKPKLAKVGYSVMLIDNVSVIAKNPNKVSRGFFI